MKYYIDNFRGLQNQIIDLKKVNFLVGENSSGKTSIIKALAIIGNPNFWLEGTILAEDVEFSCFGDMVSGNKSLEEFSLGIIEGNSPKETMQVFCFRNDHGLPKLSREIIFINNLLMVIYLEDKIYYQIKENCTKEDFDLIIRNLQNVNSVLNSDEKKSIPLRLPICFVPSFIIESNTELKHKYGRPFERTRFPRNISCLYTAPIRAKPQKIYSGVKNTYSSEGSHIPYMLKNVIDNHDTTIGYLKKFGQDSGLFDGVDISVYGDKEYAPFELTITKSGKEYGISTVGYGVSQILPIVVNMIYSKDRIILIQQPEVHLHPKAQAAFGEFLFHLSTQNDRRKFVIETHSDYIIDRFRYCMSQNPKKTKADVFFTKNQGDYNNVQLIPIQEDGKYEGDDIAEYREFFIDESIKMMEI